MYMYMYMACNESCTLIPIGTSCGLVSLGFDLQHFKYLWYCGHAVQIFKYFSAVELETSDVCGAGAKHELFWDQ